MFVSHIIGHECRDRATSSAGFILLQKHPVCAPRWTGGGFHGDELPTGLCFTVAPSSRITTPLVGVLKQLAVQLPDSATNAAAIPGSVLRSVLAWEGPSFITAFLQPCA
jgi:hypothetical protein